MRPNSIKPYGQNHAETPHQTWLALFSKDPCPGFRVYDEFGMIRIFKKQPPYRLLQTIQQRLFTKNLVKGIIMCKLWLDNAQ